MILRDKDKNSLHEIFNSIDGEFSVLLFGSRIKGLAHPGSDMDLALVSKKTIDYETLNLLREKIKNSAIPVLVDINRLSDLPEWLQTDILNNHFELYKR